MGCSFLVRTAARTWVSFPGPEHLRRADLPAPVDLRGRWSPASSVKAASAAPDVPRRQNTTERWESHTQDSLLSLKRHFSSHPSLLQLYSGTQTCTNNGATLLAPAADRDVGSQSERCNITCALFLNAEFFSGDQSKCLKLDWWRQKQTREDI